ncbi:uncharacterized protein BYT42DRAFT_584587 [Radiomyces spectabilis]|uniref:uncharacterized protein n=1 Tax=Radiomyces spectabilis TaxID=64574 RepID=UPI00221F7701|nr:uncharacterized protein BYT42DRAFT_584587 [Radiomyces spectabilis]KAI8369474.1 hypothetical protein BYT42DRAFT_584587 [Radiomyces spectabilis]
MPYSGKRSNFTRANTGEDQTHRGKSWLSTVADCLGRTTQSASVDFERIYDSMGFPMFKYQTDSENSTYTNQASPSFTSPSARSHSRGTQYNPQLHQYTPLSRPVHPNTTPLLSLNSKHAEVQCGPPSKNPLDELATDDDDNDTYYTALDSFVGEDCHLTTSRHSRTYYAMQADIKSGSSSGARIKTVHPQVYYAPGRDSLRASERSTTDTATGTSQQLQNEAQRLDKLSRDVEDIKRQLQSIGNPPSTPFVDLMRDKVPSETPVTRIQHQTPPSFEVPRVRFEDPSPSESPISRFQPHSPLKTPRPRFSSVSPSSPHFPSSPPDSPLRPRSTLTSRVTKVQPSISLHGHTEASRVIPDSKFLREALDKTPSSQHKDTMQKIVNAIPHVRLRRTDTITDPDGITRPNPFWNEIYKKSRRRQSVS